jgi:hypothetical protein
LVFFTGDLPSFGFAGSALPRIALSFYLLPLHFAPIPAFILMLNTYAVILLFVAGRFLGR